MKDSPIYILVFSLLRHIITTGLFALVAMFKLPEEFKAQVVNASNVVAASIVTFLAWLFLKYGALLAKKVGYVKLLIFSFAGFAAFSMTSCANLPKPSQGQLNAGYELLKTLVEPAK